MAEPSSGEIRPPSEWEDPPEVDVPAPPQVEHIELPEWEDPPVAVAAPDPIEDVLTSKKFSSLNRDLNISGLALSMASMRDEALRGNRERAYTSIDQGDAPFTFDDVFDRIKHRIDDVEGYQEALQYQGFSPDYLMTEIGVKGRPVAEVLAELETQGETYMLTPAKRKIKVRGGLIRKSGVERLKAQGKPVPEELLRADRYNYRIWSPDDDGPEAEAVVVQEGTEGYQNATRLFSAYFDEDTKRGAYYSEALADANGNMFNERGLRVFQDNITNYEMERWLEKQIAAGRTEITELHPEYDQEKNRQLQKSLKVAALARTVGRWHSPMWLSWERVTGVERPDESDHSWLRKAWNRGSRVRLELVGIDHQGVPVYRTTSPVWHMFEMADSLQSAAVGAVDRVDEWASESEEDRGTLLEAMSEGALEGIEDRRHLLEYAMGTEWAKTSTAGAWTMGTVGFIGLLFTPDLFVGAAGLAKMTRKVSQGTSRWTKSGRILRKTIDEMAEGAVAESKAAEAMSRARQAVDADDWDLAERELLEAANLMRRGEEAEKYIRKEAQFAADTVDMGEEMIYLRQRRNVPDIAPKDGNALADQIPGAFGHRSENLHPSVRKAQFRGEIEHQLASYRDFYNQSDSIERLVDSIRMVRRGEAEWTGELSRRIVGPHRDGLVQWLSSQGISRAQLQDSPEKLKRVVRFLDYLQDYETTRLIVHDSGDWVDGLRNLARQLPLPEETMYKLLGDMDLSDVERTRGALDNIADSILADSVAFAARKKKAVPDQAAMFKAIGRAISAVEANIETRAASMTIVRDLIASAKGLKAAPIMVKAANKFDEVRDLSPTALQYRDQIQTAFEMTDDEATAAARFLDMLAENWGNRTGRDPVEYFAETFAPEAFKDKAAFMRRLFKPPPPYIAEDIAVASLPAGYRVEKEEGVWRILDEADEVLGSAQDPLDAAATAIDKLIERGVMTKHELDLSATRVGPLLLGQPMSVVIRAIHKLPHEHFLAHTDDGVHLVRHTDGQTNSVGYGVGGVNRLMKADNVTSIHNHPNNSIFSATDIVSAAVVDERRGLVTNPDGSYWVLDTPDGFGDYSKAVLRQKYGSLTAVPADKELDRMAFSYELRAAGAASAVDAHRRIAEEVAGGRQLSRKEATELFYKYYSEAFGGAPDADGVYRSGRLSGVLQQRGVNHALTRVGPEDAVTRTGQGLEPTFGERARRAAAEEGLDILFSRATQNVPKAARAVEANLKEGVLARDGTGRVIAQESPEFIDIEKVTRGPRFVRDADGVLLDQRKLTMFADELDPPGGPSILEKLRKVYSDHNIPPSSFNDSLPWVVQRNFERLISALRTGKAPAITGAGHGDLSGVVLIPEKIVSAETIRYYAREFNESLDDLRFSFLRHQATVAARKRGITDSDQLLQIAEDATSIANPLLYKNPIWQLLEAEGLFRIEGRVETITSPMRLGGDVGETPVLKVGSREVYAGPELTKDFVASARTRMNKRVSDTGGFTPDVYMQKFMREVGKERAPAHPDLQAAAQVLRSLEAALYRAGKDADQSAIDNMLLWADLMPTPNIMRPDQSIRPLRQGVRELVWDALGISPKTSFDVRVTTKQDVIDQLNGLPWFHGTQRKQVSLLDYSLEYSGSAYGNMMGPGLYLALDMQAARRYAGALYGPERGALKTVDVRVRDLLDTTGSAEDVIRQLQGGPKNEGIDLIFRTYEELKSRWPKGPGKGVNRPDSGKALWQSVSDELNRNPAEATRVAEGLLERNIDGIYHYGEQDGHVLILFDPNANRLNGAVGSLMRESGIRPERFLYQKVAQQTEWEMKELGEGLVELTSAEIRAGKGADDALGGGLTFKVDGDVLRVQSVEIPEVLRGKGIGQEMYLRALEHAKSIGKGFASDLAPSPSAIAVYERMIENGAPLTRKMVEAADGKMVQQFVASADDLRRLDVDAVRRVTDDVPPGMLKQEIDNELRGATEFLDDGRAIIYGLNKPSFATFIHEIGHVMRRDLDSGQMDTIAKWLRETEGVEVSVKGARFGGSPEAVIQAEEKFARAFEVYVRTGEAPQPALKKIFAQMKEWMVAFYGKIRGLDVTMTPEVKKVFDDMVRQAPPKRPLLKGMAKMLKDELVGTSLRGSVRISVLNEISREARKLGHDISVDDLLKQLDDTAAVDAKARGIKKGKGEGHILLPGPVYMGGRFPEGQWKFTSTELMDVLADLQMRKRMVSGPGPRVALKKRAEAIQEMTPSEIIDNFVKSGKNDGIAAWTRNIMIGGDAFEDMRYLPKEVRDAALAVPRRVEQTVGDAIHFVAEGDIETVMKYLTGERVVFRDSGREALSSGHDMMGSVVLQLRRFFSEQGPLTNAERDALVDFIESIHVHKTSAEFIQSTKKKHLVAEALAKLTSRSSSSPFITEVLQAAGIKPGSKLTPDVFGTAAKPGRPSSIVEALTYAAGVTRRAPEGAGRVKSFDDLKYFEAAQEMDTAEVFAQLYKDMRTPSLFGSDPRTANRIVVLIAAYGTAAKAMNRWVDLGIAVEPRAATAFKKWIVGEAVESEADMARVLQLYQVHGFSPNFVEGMDLFGMNMYVPSKVRKRLSNALARATDPEMSATLKGDFLEAIGGGTAVTKHKGWMRFAWLYRYLKTRMVRGNFILKTRYFTMNTFDHFNQMALVTGFRPAFVSTTRMVTQNALSNPLGQSIIVLAGKFGAEGAAEAVRRKLQSAGDLGAHFASRILMGSKWRLDLNMVLEGTGTFRLGGNVYSGKQIRDIALESGIFSSFDTSQLGMKIQDSVDLFLEGAKKSDPDFYRKAKKFIDLRDLYRVSQDIAEGWSERERLGAMLTLMEMGMDPHTAARVTIKALYDYAGSMSKWDRHFVINMFLPFWAFQKNANRQLIDAVFSPWGAYRLGIMRRAWDHGTDLISDMMYFDMVDEYGVNTQNMPPELRDAYYAVKLALVEHYGTPDAIPDEVHKDIALWVSGRTTSSILADRYQWTGTELQNALMQTANQRLTGYYVPQPKDAHRKGFRRIRPGIALPHEYSVNMRKFLDGVQVADPSTPYTFVMTPEPVYTAAFHHMGNMTASMVLLAHKLVTHPMAMIEEDDGTESLASPLTPLKEVISPQRAPLLSELLAEFGMDEGIYPVKLHESLVGTARAHGVEVFETTPVEDPYATEQERKAALEDAREALGFVGVTKEKRYYMQPGAARLIFVNNPIGEYNRLLMSWTKTPLEEAAKQGEVLRWARMVGLDVEEVWPTRTIKYEARRAREELGSEKVYEKKRKGRPKKSGEK